MDYETLKVTQKDHAVILTLYRPAKANSINEKLLQEINLVLDTYENRKNILAIIIEGNEKIFCAGMDFQEVFGKQKIPKTWIKLYAKTLKRFTEISKIMIAKVDGKVLAGGVGLVAACDVIFASSQTTFSLPEVLWGLLPANVLPYLIRRMGFQKAYLATITTEIEAEEIADYIDQDISSFIQKLSRINPATIKHMKNYFKRLWIINSQTEKLAINTLQNLMKSDLVQTNVRNFLDYKKLPLEK